MESLAPLLLIAALGLIAALDVLGRAVSARARKPLALAGAALILAWLGVASWHDYFERNQKSYDLLSLTRANAVECLRAVHDENLKGPVVVITTRQLAFDSWQMPSPDPWRGQEFEALNPDVVWMVNGSSPDYCRKKGFFGSLDWALDQAGALKQRDGKDRDVLVVLDPFYFYLEPLLHSLGGRTVRELPVLQSTEGPVLGDIGQAPTRDFIAKLVRLHGLQTRDMDALRDRLFRFRLGEMKPPGRMGRQAAAALVPASPGYRALLEGWEAHPERWSVSRTAEVDVPDPWSWDSVLQFYDAPMLLRSSFDLLIPVDGLYSFGASATPITLLRVDRKRVFFRDPAEPAQGGASSDPSPPFPPERVGYLGKAVYLKAGAHRLDLDQLLVNPTANYALRLIWRKPGGLLETLPLEVLRPAPL